MTDTKDKHAKTFTSAMINLSARRALNKNK